MPLSEGKKMLIRLFWRALQRPMSKGNSGLLFTVMTKENNSINHHNKI